MVITTKSATMADIPACCEVEKASMPSLTYLNEVKDYFLNGTKGDLTCAYVDGVLAGIGKLTVLHDGTGWLETLRVAPQFQGIGVGKAIYRRYIDEGIEFGCKSLAMYTGISNDVSAGLAKYNGFSLAYTAREMAYKMNDEQKNKADTVNEFGFKKLGADEAAALIMQHAKDYPYIAFNRTFYAMNAATCKGFANEGTVYLHEQTGTAVILGARMQKHLALHMGFACGDIKLAANFAKAVAAQWGVPKITTVFKIDREAFESRLLDAGFEKTADLIVMKGDI